MNRQMGDAHIPVQDPHLQAVPTMFPAHIALDSLHEHDFTPTDFDNAAHHNLSPLSMNQIPGSLSRPASMASMTLPPGQTLSRVSSLSNLHQAWQPPYYPVYITSGFSVPNGQGQQIHIPQQAYQTSQYAVGSTFAMPGLIFNEYIPAPHVQQVIAKPAKKTKSKRPSNGNGGDGMNGYPMEPVPKTMKLQKQASSKSLDGDLPARPARSRNPSSVFRGVSKCSKDGRWQARIRVKRTVTYLGRFVHEEDAARRYDEAARIHHGDKAVLNFPTPEDKNLGRKQAVNASGSAGDDDDEDDSE